MGRVPDWMSPVEVAHQWASSTRGQGCGSSIIIDEMACYVHHLENSLCSAHAQAAVLVLDLSVMHSLRQC